MPSKFSFLTPTTETKLIIKSFKSPELWTSSRHTFYVTLILAEQWGRIHLLLNFGLTVFHNSTLTIGKRQCTIERVTMAISCQVHPIVCSASETRCEMSRFKDQAPLNHTSYISKWYSQSTVKHDTMWTEKKRWRLCRLFFFFCILA